MNTTTRSRRLHKREAGVSLTELMVSITILGLIFGAATKFAMDINSARETVDRNIQIDQMRWYIRDSLDCRQTLGIGSKTQLPLKCSDFRKDGNLTLRARPMAGASRGAEINTVFEQTKWKFRAYCENNGLVIDYAPRTPMKVDEQRKLGPRSHPTDIVMPRELRPIQVATTLTVPGTLGFGSLVGKLGNDNGPEKCPATSSLGTLIALARFAAQTFLNSAPVENSTLNIDKKWLPEMSGSLSSIDGQYAGLMNDLSGIAPDVLQKSIQEAQQYSKQWLGRIATDALKKGGNAVIGGVAGSLLQGKGIDIATIGKQFTQGTLNEAARLMGAPPVGTNIVNMVNNGKFGLYEMVDGAPVLDSGLNLGAKIPLQMFAAITDVTQQVNTRMEQATQIMISGLNQGLPNSQLAKDAVRAVWDLDRFIREEASAKTFQALDYYVGNTLRGALHSQIDGVKAGIEQKFAQIEADARAGNSSPGVLSKILSTIGLRKNDVLRQVDGMKKSADNLVLGLLNQAKDNFMKQLNAMLNDSKIGIRPMLQKYLEDLQKGNQVTPDMIQNAMNSIKFDNLSKMPQGQLPVPTPPDGYWTDLFEGTTLLCREHFRPNPMRDFAANSNPCPYVSPAYPVMARKHGEIPICCREVSAVGGGEAICAANEVSWMGGADCSSPAQPLTGQQVGRQDVLPAFQGNGFGLAFGFNVMPSFGGGVLPTYPPQPHQHTVNGGAKVIIPPIGPTAITVNQVYADTPKFLGGFLRSNSIEHRGDNRIGGQSSLCYFANKRYSRSDDWTGPTAVHASTPKALCCPTIGIRP